MTDTTLTTKPIPQIHRTWWKESTVYQVYPASFASANCTVEKGTNEVRGDLRGIIQKLDYIESLGVDIVWLSPILQSPQVDNGYDISDYRAIDPVYGSMEDHDELVQGLHDRGMKYVMDLVVNHTSDHHEWFKQSRSSKSNPYRDWYMWRPAKLDNDGNRQPPNNWESAFSGSVWEWDEHTQEYYLHLFAKEQPDLNWENPKVRDAVHDMIRFWLKKGVDGFRMDVINFISKAEGLPDADVQKDGFLQRFSRPPSLVCCGPRLHEYLRGIGEILLEYDAFSVGEMPGVKDTKEILKGVGGDRGELQMAFQFDVVGMDIDPKGGSKWDHRDFHPNTLRQAVNKWQTFMLENGGWNATFMENHDQGRSVSRYVSDSDRHRTKSAKLLACHMGLLSGTIFVYQGQELACINIPESWSLDRYKDLETLNHWKRVLEQYPDDKEKQSAYLRQYRLVGRDNARLPMKWTSSPSTYAGFLPSSAPKDAKPWMHVHDDFRSWNAETLLADKDSAFHYWARILKLRKEHRDLLGYGQFEMFDLDDEDGMVVAYLRTETATSDDSNAFSGKRCLVITNFSAEETWWAIPKAVQDMMIKGGSLNDGAVVQELRNYTGKESEAGNQVRTVDGDWALRLRAWEALVAIV